MVRKDVGSGVVGRNVGKAAAGTVDVHVNAHVHVHVHVHVYVNVHDDENDHQDVFRDPDPEHGSRSPENGPLRGPA